MIDRKEVRQLQVAKTAFLVLSMKIAVAVFSGCCAFALMQFGQDDGDVIPSACGVGSFHQRCGLLVQ